MTNVVISDTDIIVHMVKGQVFSKIMPLLIDQVYITPKVDEELRLRHAGVYGSLTPFFAEGKWLFKLKPMWKDFSSEQKRSINETKDQHRARLDPGELDCLAYATGLGIPAIISDDKGAKEIISLVTKNKKVVLTFWDLLVLGAKKDKLSWSDAKVHYEAVKRACSLKLPDFEFQVRSFEDKVQFHPWVQKFLES
jgi:hypothetical protein